MVDLVVAASNETERNHLRRELHDVVGHALGAIAIQLTALDERIAAGDPPELVRACIATMHGVVRDGLEEARDTIAALSDDRPDLTVLTRRLCDLHRVAYAIGGEPQAITPAGTLALHRVLQEALTNAHKHSPGAAVRVELTFDPETVSLRVANEPCQRGRVSPLATSGGGYGLRGLRERIELAGGRLQAGPSDDGWEVVARVPSMVASIDGPRSDQAATPRR